MQNIEWLNLKYSICRLIRTLLSDSSDTLIYKVKWLYAPINSKPQHPTPGIHRAFDCASCRGRGEFERCLGRVGNLNRIYLLFWRNTPVSFFGFCRVWRISKIEFRLFQWITLSKGSLKEVWRCHYGTSLSARRVKRLTEDEICLWGEVLQN